MVSYPTCFSSSSLFAPTTRCRCCAATTPASTCTWTCAAAARPTSTSSPCRSSPNLSGSTTRPTAPGGLQQLSVIEVKNIWTRTIVQWMNEIDPNRGWRMLVTQLPCDCSVSSLAVPKAPTGEQRATCPQSVSRVTCQAASSSTPASRARSRASTTRARCVSAAANESTVTPILTSNWLQVVCQSNFGSAMLPCPVEQDKSICDKDGMCVGGRTALNNY